MLVISHINERHSMTHDIMYRNDIKLMNKKVISTMMCRCFYDDNHPVSVTIAVESKPIDEGLGHIVVNRQSFACRRKE